METNEEMERLGLYDWAKLLESDLPLWHVERGLVFSEASVRDKIDTKVSETNYKLHEYLTIARIVYAYQNTISPSK